MRLTRDHSGLLGAIGAHQAWLGRLGSSSLGSHGLYDELESYSVVQSRAHVAPRFLGLLRSGLSHTTLLKKENQEGPDTEPLENEAPNAIP